MVSSTKVRPLFSLQIFSTNHDGGREGEVTRDRGEVEGRDAGHEAVEGPVAHQVERDFWVFADGLVAVDQLLAEETVEAEEVDQLGGSVNLGLNTTWIRSSCTMTL